MSMQARMAAAGKRVATLKAAVESKPAQPAKPRIRVVSGGTVTEDMLREALGLKPKAVGQLARWLESKVADHHEGGSCPHCHGTGRYLFHTDPRRNERCFRCNGKGRLDARDMAFFLGRVRGAGPVCHVSAATAA